MNTLSKDTLSKIISSAVADKISVQTEGLEIIKIAISPSKLVETIGSAIYEAVQSRSFSELPFTEETFNQCMVKVFEYRILQVNRKRVDKEYSWRDVIYPTLLMPVLELIGIYDNEKDGYRIVPELPEGYVSVDVSFDEVQRVMRYMSAKGMYIAHCLPNEIEVTDPSLYMLAEVDTYLSGPTHITPAPPFVFARIMLKMGYLNTVFGNARVQYAAIRRLEQGVLNAVNDHLHAGRD